MFYTPKPRQFHYEPRYYDAEKEKWEALKQKYAQEDSENKETEQDSETISDNDITYFQQRVRALDREESQKNSRLGWKDLFRKREMPTFHYQSRFQGDGASSDEETATSYRPNVKIRRRFDMESNEYMKPVSGGKIMISVLLVCLLLYWILF